MLTMLCDTKLLEDIVVNLDSRRIPLNAQQREEIRGSGKYPYIGANGVIDFIDEFIFDEEILCIAEDGGDWSFRSLCAFIVRGKSWVNNHAHVVMTKEGTNIRYLCHYLNYADLSPYITGTTRGKLTQRALNGIKIPHPPLEIQGKIADILDKAQELIDIRQRQIELLDEFLQSVFLDMFGDPVTNPEAWPLCKLSELGQLNRGKSQHRPRNDPILLGGPYPLIQTGDVAKAGLYIDDFSQTYSERGLAQSKLWPSGTLCITIAANIAKTGILTFDACFPDSVVAFSPNEKANINFIQFWFIFLQEIIEANAPESAQKNINLRILENLDVICPPKELQDKFAVAVQDVEQKKNGMKVGLTELQNLFNSIMQRAFKGELFN